MGNKYFIEKGIVTLGDGEDGIEMKAENFKIGLADSDTKDQFNLSTNQWEYMARTGCDKEFALVKMGFFPEYIGPPYFPINLCFACSACGTDCDLCPVDWRDDTNDTESFKPGTLCVYEGPFRRWEYWWRIDTWLSRNIPFRCGPVGWVVKKLMKFYAWKVHDRIAVTWRHKRKDLW